MAGRPRKPAALKVLDGEKNKDRRYEEPQTALVTFSEVPEGLGEHGERLWRDMAPKLGRLGVTSEMDGAAFFLLCRAWQSYMEKPDDMKRLVAVKGLLTEFGMTPAARSKVSGHTNKQAADPMERLLAGGL